MNDGVLQQVSSSILRSEHPSTPEFVLRRCEEAIDAFVKDLKQNENVRTLLLHLLGSKRPIERIEAILNTANEPPPVARKKFTNLKNGRQPVKSWAENEDNRLLYALHIYGLDQWLKVSEFVGNNRDRMQCSQRWSRVLNPSIQKTKWTKIEDDKLINYIRHFGDKAWKLVANEMKNRSDTQCRYRYYQLIKKKDIRLNSSASSFDLWGAPEAIFQPVRRHADILEF